MAAASGPNIIEDGLVLALDAGNNKSAPVGIGTIWDDISGNNNTVSGIDPSYDMFQSYAGGVFSFDGLNEEIYLNDSESLRFTNALFSINVWIYIDSLSNSFPIINKRGQNELDNLDYSFEVSSDGKVRWIIDSDLVCETATGLIEQGNWYNLTATHDGNTAKIYINGVQSVSVSSNKSFLSFKSVLIRIGYAFSTWPSKVYGMGKISIISMYDRPLTPQEVSQNYNAIKGRYVDPGTLPPTLFDNIKTLATTLASATVPSPTNLQNIQSLIESANSSFNVFAVVGRGNYAESLTGTGVAGGKRTHTAKGFNYNTSSSNILSTGNTIENMMGGYRDNLNVIDGKKWMAMAQFDGTNFDGILLWIFTGDSVNSSGTVTSGTRSVSNVKDIFYPEGSGSNYHHFYPIAINPDGTIVSNTTSGASGWNFSSNSSANSTTGYYSAVSGFSNDDGIWAFKIPGYVDGDGLGTPFTTNGYGIGNYSGGGDNSTNVYWNGVNEIEYDQIGFVFSGDA